MERKGGCMCGAVRFTAQEVPAEAGACHCEMCRRWTGSALIGVTVPLKNVTWEDETHLGRIQSSPWAERGFCTRCGSGMFFRVTMESEYSDDIELPIGVFDEADGFEITNEIYIDVKPDSFAYEGQAGRKLMTRAECHAKFGVLGDSE
ncbi:GFA family protein [Mameliella sp. CS4]|uniref:GFA family protein n=1 Tax=Mameliella sp. CS4 TaxID=2862329 RepID=UPI002107749D|nr:GFA family protein [Mameliella sp. CS4]